MNLVYNLKVLKLCLTGAMWEELFQKYGKNSLAYEN